MRVEVVAVIAVVAILAGAGVGFLVGQSNTGMITAVRTITSTVILVGSPEVATDTNHSLGIELIFAINNSVIRQGQYIQTVVEMLNVLPNSNNLSVEERFPVIPSFPKCIPGDWTPLDDELYSGVYGRNNITSAKPITYYRTCPPVFNNSLTQYNYYVFEPRSSNATLFGLSFSGASGYTGVFSLRYVNQISLYQFTSSLSNNTLPVGKYTMIEEDSWGQIVFLHFEVIP